MTRPALNGELRGSERFISAAHMTRAQLDYEASRNPTYAWHAYYFARRAQLEIPKSVLEYLDRVAGHVFESSEQWDKLPTEGQVAGALAKAFEFPRGGRTNPLRAPLDRTHQLSIAMEVEAKIEAGHKPDMAFDLVADEHPRGCARCTAISRRTVIRHYRLYEPMFARIKEAHRLKRVRRRKGNSGRN